MKKEKLLSKTIHIALLLLFSGPIFSQTITIVGDGTIGPGAQTTYVANFNYDPNPSSVITWTVTRGTIISQNVNPASTIYCTVQWNNIITSDSVLISEVPPSPLTSHSAHKTVDIVCASANAGADQSYCVSGSITIGTPAIPGYAYSWSPTTGLSNPNIAQPTANPSTTTTYRLTMTPVNLFLNGDFESGFTGFSTDYGTYPVGDGGCGGTNTYGSVTVTTNPRLLGTQWCYKTDHSPIGDKMLFADGSCTSNRRVWYESVTVAQNTDYYFSGWASPNVYDFDLAGYIPLLRVRINGTNLIQNFSVPWNPVGCENWLQFATPWNSGSSTTATIEIYDDNTNDAANDFSLDDLFFTNCAITTDDVTVTVGTSTPVVTPGGPITYYNQYESSNSVTLTCNPAPTYQWYKNNVAISGATNQTYLISFTGYTTYTDYYKCITSCGTSNVVTFNYVGCIYDYEYPVTNTWTVCLSNYPRTLYQISMGAGATYSWSTDNSCYSLYNFSGTSCQVGMVCSPPWIGAGIFTRGLATNGAEVRSYFGIAADWFCKSTNFNEFQKNGISSSPFSSNTRIFPTPAKDHATFRSQDNIISIDIFSTAGIKLKHIDSNRQRSMTIETKDFTTGIYLCKLITNKGVEYAKLVIQR